MRYFLRELRIDGFRGINNDASPLRLTFREDAVNSVFAVNGSGKSSIFEAITFAVHGFVPRLKALHATESGQAYLINRFHSRQTATIDLAFAEANSESLVSIRVTVSGDGTRSVTSPSGHANPSDFLRMLSSESVFLDYSTFRRFTEDSPLDRGRSFASLIGLARLSEFRQMLEVLANTRTVKSDLGIDKLTSDLAVLRNEYKQNQMLLASVAEQLFGEPQSPDSPTELSAAACQLLRSQRYLEDVVTAENLGDVDFSSLRRRVRELEQGDKRDKLALVLSTIVRLEAIAPGELEETEHDELRSLLNQYDSALAATRGSASRRVFEAVRELYSSGEWTDALLCPACDSTLQESLPKRIDSQLQAYENVNALRTKIRESWERARWVDRLRRLEESEEVQSDGQLRAFTTLDHAFRRGEPAAVVLEEAIAALKTFEERRIQALKKRAAERVQIESELPPSLVELTRLIECASQLAICLATQLRLIKEGSEVADTLKRRIRFWQFLVSASQRFADAEVRLSTRRVMELETEYRSMYSTIMRDPQVVPKLVKSENGEDLHLRLERFHGHEGISANAVLSESYRNALAISIFLSAALKNAGAARFIVLDDITSSFDSGHQFALMELLHNRIAHPNNPNGPQVVILSHDGLLQKYFDQASESRAWHHQRLKGAAPVGLALTDAFEGARIRQIALDAISIGDTERAEPLVRQYLEFRLFQVIQKVRVPVPVDFAIRDERKMVANAIEAITAAVSLHERAGDLVLQPWQRNQLSLTLVPALVGNWVSHYATGSLGNLSGVVLGGVLTDIDSFVECFKYECRCEPQSCLRFYRSLTSRQCACV